MTFARNGEARLTEVITIELTLCHYYKQTTTHKSAVYFVGACSMAVHLACIVLDA